MGFGFGFGFRSLVFHYCRVLSFLRFFSVLFFVKFGFSFYSRANIGSLILVRR
jgi:hypothetical protein